MASTDLTQRQASLRYGAGAAPAGLRTGRKRTPRDAVSAIQRERMIVAAVAAIEDVGYARMTVEQVISRARVSRKTFYDLFDDREDCFLAAFEQMLADTREVVEPAYREQCDWRDALRAALAALLDEFDRAPAAARVFVVESLAGGERMLRRRAELIDGLARAIDGGRAAMSGPGPTGLTAPALVGGVASVLHTRLVRDDPEPFRALLGPLMSVIVLPYLGPDAAARETSMARPRERRPRRRVRREPAKDPLDGLSMRLTHRTSLVLGVIAQSPGASNREIAKASGIVDQGQISKLLSRLAGLDLVENTGAGQTNGATNAWRLTARGERLERATRRH
jgi:AcrR family transcriptional regulator